VDGRLTAQANTIPRPTDDRGQYRVIGLRPGTYVVAAMPPPAVSVGTVGTDGARGYASIYYPGTADAATAQRIALAAGRDAQGIDISFFPTPTASVTGVVVDATGRPFPGRPVSLSVSGRSGGVSMSSYGATTDDAGAFVIRNVPPGDYVVKFLGLDGARSFGMQYVTVVDDDPPPVRVTVSGGATLEGRVVIEAASNIDIGGLTVSVASADFDYTPPPPQGSQLNTFRREDDGSFRATGAIGPSRIVVIALGCEPCYLKSAYVNGTDAAHRPFDFGLQGGLYRNVDVTVSDGGATIEGHVLDERDARAATYAVVVFPVDRSLVHSRSAYVKAARAQADGSFRVTGLPPGDYVAAAVSRLDFGISEISDDDVLDQLAPRGQRVSLAERERRALTLTLVRR
jgi:hypothetical protein